MIFNGTRQPRQIYTERPETRFPNGRYRRDVGMTKLLVISATFTSADAKITDAAADFSAAAFAVGDQINIWGSALNNGVRKITAVSTTSITVDWPVKEEGPTASVTVRIT